MKKYRNYIIVVVILSLLTFQIYRELTRTDILIWSEKPIAWENFNPSTWLPTGFGTTIKTGIKCDIKIDSEKANVYAFMNKKESRVLDSIKPTKRMLRHEQIHFNITEFQVRLLRKELINLGEEKVKKNI